MKLIFRGIPPIMSYHKYRLEEKILDEGKVGRVAYKIMNLGTHPCAYIGILAGSKHKLICEDTNINVHGGCTFHAEGGNRFLENSHDWIGWDYAHSGDYVGYKGMSEPDSKKWTFSEILEDVLNAAEEIERTWN